MIRPIYAGQIEAVVEVINRAMPAFIERYKAGKSTRCGFSMRKELETKEQVKSYLDMYDAWFIKLSSQGDCWVFEVDIEKVLASDWYALT